MHNLAVAEAGTQSGAVYTYPEWHGRKTADESITILNMEIESRVDKGCREVILIGDNQVPIKCWATIWYCDAKVQQTANLDMIRGLHYKPGHAYNDGDRIGGIASRSFKRRACYTPDHVVDAINKSTKKGSIKGKIHNCIVIFLTINLGILVARDSFKDFQSEVEKEYITPPKIRLRDIESWKVSKQHPGQLAYTYNIEDPTAWTFVRLRRVRQPVASDLANVAQLYIENLPMKVLFIDQRITSI